MSDLTRRADLGPVTVALVNNMPDGAFLDTERQFRRAAQSAYGAQVDVDLYTICDVARAESIGMVIEERYHDLDELTARGADALIVTGTEPTHDRMTDEPSWPATAELLRWAAESVPAVLLSCLAAHASLLLFDGIERMPLAHKCSGVFDGLVCDPGDPLTRRLPVEVPVPHSRCNEVPEHALRGAGYRILVGGAGSPAGWAVAAREHDQALFVLCQGHPEYDTLSLLREYRRDVRRYLFGEGERAYPALPQGYLPHSSARRLERFADRAAAAADPRALWREFPYDEIAATVPNTWAAVSSTLYANWMARAGAVTHAGV